MCCWQGDLATALPALQLLDVRTPSFVSCRLWSLPSSMRHVRLEGACVALVGSDCPIAPELTVIVESIMLILVSRGAESPCRTRSDGAKLLVAARNLRLQSDWMERNPGQQPSAEAVLVDSVTRQPFAELSFCQQRKHQPLQVECVPSNGRDQPLCRETFDSLQQLHVRCSQLAMPAGASCHLSSGSYNPALTMTFRFS